MPHRKTRRALEAHAKIWRRWVCVGMRSLHSKLPLKLEEELNSQRVRIRIFIHKPPFLYNKDEFYACSPPSHSF